MTRKNWMLLALAVMLGCLSLYLNRDWFSRDNIQIFHRSSPPRPGVSARRRQEPSAVNPVLFGFDRKLKLTSLKVVPVSDIETNKYPHPIWQLISESNSVPTKEFFYGSSIHGMHPRVEGATAESLEPGIN